MAINDSAINEILVGGAVTEAEGIVVPDVIISGTVNSSTVNFGLVGANSIIEGTGETTVTVEGVSGTVNSSVVNFGLINSQITEVVGTIVGDGKIHAQHEAGFEDKPRQQNQHEASFQDLLFVKNQHSLIYTARFYSVEQHSTNFHIFEDNVDSQNSSAYGIKVSVQHEAVQSLRVSNSHLTPFSIQVGAQHKSVFDSGIFPKEGHEAGYVFGETRVRSSNDAVYYLTKYTFNQHVAPSSFRIHKQFEAVHGVKVSYQFNAQSLFTVSAGHTVDYSLNTRIPNQFTYDYDNKALVTVSNQHEAPSLLKVQNITEINYAVRGRTVNASEITYDINLHDPVVAQHEAPSLLKVSNSFEDTYSLRIVENSSNEFSYDIKLLGEVTTQHEASSLLRVTNDNANGYSIKVKVVAEQELPYAVKLLASVRNQHEAGDLLKVSNSNKQTYSSRSFIVSSNESNWSMTTLLAQQNEAGWELKQRDFVINQHKNIYNVGATTIVNITDVPFVELNGELIEIIDASLSQDEDGYAWLGVVILAKIEDYQKFTNGDAFTVNLFGELFELIVDSKGLNRSNPSEVGLSVSGLSPTALLASPRGESISKLWDTPVLAKDAAEEFLGGEVIDWQLVNWTIPAFALGVSDITPIELVQLIAKSAGGVVETKPDGSLLVRPRHKIKVPDYGISIIDQTYTDSDDNISVVEGQGFSKELNKIAIRDQSVNSTDADTIEFIVKEDDSTAGILKAYPSPFRDINITHTGPVGVLLSKLGEITRTETEIIEIFDGSGSVKYPIESVVSISWLDTNLGGITFSGKQVKSTSLVDRFGLLEIVYETKSINYEAQYAISDRQIQFLMETA